MLAKLMPMPFWDGFGLVGGPKAVVAARPPRPSVASTSRETVVDVIKSGVLERNRACESKV
jgi:hypothetical protein